MKTKLFLTYSFIILLISCNYNNGSVRSNLDTLLSSHEITESSVSENFITFLSEISRDTSFQSQRIIFPLTYEYLNSDDHEILSKLLKENEWQHIKFVEYKQQDAYIGLLCLNEECSYSDYKTYIFHFSGIENGINVRYHFEQIKGKWYLVKVRDLST